MDASSIAENATQPTVIRPARRWQVLDLGELWRYRELVYVLAWRDITVRYKQMVLGAAWALLQPGLIMIVFTLFFTRTGGIALEGLPYYPLFVYAGLVPWFFFANGVGQAGNSVVGAERLITKVYFPRLALPFSAIAAALVDFCIATGLLGVMMLWYGVAPGWNLLLAPAFAALVGLAATGFGTLLAALQVAYRDFRYVTPFLLQVGMLATPSIYLPASLDGSWSLLSVINPMVPLIASFRAACLGGDIPWHTLPAAVGVIAAVFVFGCFYFRNVEQRFADII